jgi:hypothetical protein
VSATLLAALLLAACTTTAPTPDPEPTPTPTDEPAPSGVDVAVVLPPAEDPTSLTLLDVDERLEGLAAERIGDVARIRAITVDDAGFVPDTAALLADAGADLVCVLGTDGADVVVDLAARFPAARFCATGDPAVERPDNVDLFDLAHEELGHVLGTGAALLADGGPVGVVLGGDTDERVRRRAGARAALATSSVVLDGTVADVPDAAELVDVVGETESGLAVVLLDTASTSLAEVLSTAAPQQLTPAGLATDTPATVRWSVRVDAIVGAAVDRVVAPDETDRPDRLGFAQRTFAISFQDEVPIAVRDALQVVADELARGVRDPLAAVAADPQPRQGDSVPTVPGGAGDPG